VIQESRGHGPRVVAIVPVGQLEGAKSRLGEVLDAEERHELVTRMVRRTVAASVATPGIAETLVVTPDDDVRAIATEAGGRPLRQRGRGLNQGLREARAEAIDGGADAILVLPVDVVRVTPEAIATLLEPLRDGAPLVALVPDRHGRGTNALLLAPPDAIEFCFGGDSRAAHRACATDHGVRYVELDGPLSLDVDTPEDLLLVDDRLAASEPERSPAA
jgi:2-phospho-L-lactate/phosphoenolpyruvate guanylyltransferase